MNSGVFDVYFLRKMLGIVAVVFPLIFIIPGTLVYGYEIQPAISTYYHTSLHDAFVGGLCAMGFCLIAYRGNGCKTKCHKEWILGVVSENIAGHIAGAGSIIAALVAPRPDVIGTKRVLDQLVRLLPGVSTWVHMVGGALFLVCLFLFLIQFVKRTGNSGEHFLKRLYIVLAVCMGTAIVGCRRRTLCA